MGGNAMKEYGVTRIDRDSYFYIESEIRQYLGNNADVRKFFIPDVRDDKMDFGDVDCLISTTEVEKIMNDAKNKLGIIHGENNGGVWSFVYKNFQIDFIFTQPKYFEIYKNFIYAGDASMVFGRIARLFDLKYGIYGLEFIVRDDITNHVVGEIEISTDPRKCLEFLGYDYDVWIKGFSTEEQLREFIFSSKYVTREFLTAYSENTKHRKRDKNRDQYKKLYAWFVDNKDRFPVDHGLPTDLVSRLDRVDNFFGTNVRKQYSDLLGKMINRQAARIKFSGKEIIALLNLDGKHKEIGAFIEYFNQSFGSEDDKIGYILNNSIEILEEVTIQLYNQFKNNG